MKFLGIVFLTIASVTVILEGCSQFNRSMERSLVNDKSYGHGVVEYQRKHPNKRNDGVTVTWSTADYVAMANPRAAKASSHRVVLHILRQAY